MHVVARNIGIKYLFALSIAAFHGERPFFRLWIYPSIITIELSTVIPRTTTRAARVTVLRGIPNRYIMPAEMKVFNGMTIAATSAERNGKSIIITIMITTIAIIRSRRKETTDVFTTSAWFV